MSMEYKASTIDVGDLSTLRRFCGLLSNQCFRFLELVHQFGS